MRIETERLDNTSIEDRVALVAGVTGLVGSNLADLLLAQNWKVYGLARRPPLPMLPPSSSSLLFVALDLEDETAVTATLSGMRDVTHLFWVTWTPRGADDSPERCHSNARMLRMALDALLPAGRLRHVALQTGTRHYYATGHEPWPTRSLPLSENTPRVPGASNFYYALEDVLRSKSKSGMMTWTVHRPGVIVGASARSAYNVVATLAVYAAVRREEGLPLLFPGTRRCFREAYVDASDAALVARQLTWGATCAAAANEAFHAVNGDSFTWAQLWPTLASSFGMAQQEAALEEAATAAELMAGREPTWQRIVTRHSLWPTRMDELADWELLDTLFRLPFSMLASPAKCRRFGFDVSVVDTCASFCHWLEVLRQRNLIPP